MRACVFVLCRGWRAARNVHSSSPAAAPPAGECAASHGASLASDEAEMRTWSGRPEAASRTRCGCSITHHSRRLSCSPSPCRISLGARTLRPPATRGERAPRSASPAVDKSGRNALHLAAALLLIACLCIAVRISSARLPVLRLASPGCVGASWSSHLAISALSSAQVTVTSPSA
jgi:hypothetical protein